MKFGELSGIQSMESFVYTEDLEELQDFIARSLVV